MKIKPAPETCPTCGGRLSIWTSHRNRNGRPRVTQDATDRSRLRGLWRPRLPNLGSIRVDYWYACRDPFHQQSRKGFLRDANEAVTRERRRARREVAGARAEMVERSGVEKRRKTRARRHRDLQGKDRR